MYSDFQKGVKMSKNIKIWIGVGLVSLTVLRLALRLTAPKEPPITPPITQEPEEPEPPIILEPIIRNIFNGTEIDAEQDYQAFAIMIENTKDARPHSGIGSADIVYEISVDGWAISRFFAIFGNDHPNKVGPVRSARVPFAELQKEWKLPFAHFGSAASGLGDALSIIRSLNLPIRFDGHQGINDEFYSRDSSRSAPHNAYFNAENALVKIPSLTYAPRFKYDDESNVIDNIVNEIELKYSSSNRINYKFNETSKSYSRFINDIPMMDTNTNSQVQVTNVIVLHAKHWDVESVRYVLVEFVGEGKAEFFINGKYEVGTWKKSSETEIAKYYDAAGEEVILLPGNTWIQVVHPNIEILKDSEK